MPTRHLVSPAVHVSRGARARRAGRPASLDDFRSLMHPVRSLLVALLVSAALVTGVTPAFAQSDSTQTTPTHEATQHGIEYMGGGYFVGSIPMGDWGKIAGFGLALDGASVTRMNGKPFGLRSNLGLLYNFSRSVDVPSSNLGGTDKLTIETKNWSVFFGLGPEFSMPSKDVTPFIFATVGFDTYWTKSELAGTAFGAPYSAKHGDSRIAFAWAGGLGFRRKLAPGYHAELSAESRSGIRHDFLLPEDVNTSGGAVNAKRDGHSSDQILIRLGTVFGESPGGH